MSQALADGKGKARDPRVKKETNKEGEQGRDEETDDGDTGRAVDANLQIAERLRNTMFYI